MNLDYEISREELEKKKKFFDDQRNINAKLEKDIMSLDQKISELSGSLTRDKVIREQFEDELGGLKRTVERTGLDLEKSRSELSEIKKKINEKLKL
jgi:septal ring factor EnvC (AmiA/AmiB activator)